MVYNSLTEAPHNLKEGIDWLMAVKGDDAGHNLAAIGAAIHKFLVDKPVGYTEVAALEKVKRISKEFLQQEEIKGQWYTKRMMKRLGTGVEKSLKTLAKYLEYVRESDYENVVQTQGIKPEDITENLGHVVEGCETFVDNIKNPVMYKSSYSSEATWEASCSKKPEDCAVVLVGVAPMLYTGLRHLRYASNAAVGVWQTITAKRRLGNILKAVGYTEMDYGDDMDASNVINALRYVNERTLEIIYDLSGFWAFYGSDKIGAVREEQLVEPVIPEAEPSVEGEGEQSVIPEAEPSFDGEGEQSVIPEAEPTFEGEGEQSVIPEAEPSVEPAGEEPVIPEAEPSVEPAKPEVDEDANPADKKPAKAAKVARSVKAAKKAAKKVSKKARQRKEKRKQKKLQEQQAQQESAEQ